MVSTTTPFSWRTAGITLLVLLLVAGVIFSLILPAEARFTDEHEYLAFSHNLLHGPGFSMDGVHLTAMRPPGYTFFISAIQAMGGGIVAVRWIQYALLVATIWMVARFSPAEVRDQALPIVTLLTVFYVLLFFTASTLYPQTVGAFLFVSILTLILASPRGFVTDLAAGMTFGGLIPSPHASIAAFALAFVLFRVFDIWKPWPVSWAENFDGGLGVMLDDMVAGLMAGVLVVAARYFLHL